MHIAPEIFKAYDIRGIVDKTLTSDAVFAIGNILGKMAKEKNSQAIAVGRDGRLSGEKLQNALINGILQAGVDVFLLGQVPTPMVYFAAHHLQCGSALALTGSHNPPEYNGLKMVIAGETLASDSIQGILKDIQNGAFLNAKKIGKVQNINIQKAYFERIASDIHFEKKMNIALDCGNGVAGAFAPALLEKLGAEITPLFCEVDGNFPNHHPDPSKLENLKDLQEHLKNSDCELGLAFDGDGDRLGVVLKNGNVVFPDRQLMLFAADILKREKGATILFDVKCTRLLNHWIMAHGGKPLMWKTGHALIKQKLKETGAALAGEMSGHIFFKERWFGFDDALYSAARLIEILSAFENPCAVLDNLPNAPSTPELNIAMQEGEPFLLIEQLSAAAKNYFQNAEKIITIDGLRVEYKNGFGLIRASNTTPVVVLRFEADDENALNAIQNDFRQILKDLAPHLDVPF